MPTIENQIELPLAPPVGKFTHVQTSSDLLAISGQLPMVKNKLLATGRVGELVNIEQACLCAVQCTTNALRALRHHIGPNWQVLASPFRLTVYVACGAELVSIPLIADAASQILVEAFGIDRLPARTAIGVVQLPANAPVEVELTVAIEVPAGELSQ